MTELVVNGGFDASTVYGANLVNDGGFDDEVSPKWWFTNASFAAGGARLDNATPGGGYVAVTQIAYTNITPTIGKEIEVSVDITAYTSGQMQCYLAGGSTGHTFPMTVGTHKIAFINDGHSSGRLTFTVTGSTHIDLTFDNVTVRQVMPPTGWTDMSESGGSIVVDSDGHLQLNNPNGLNTEEGKAAHEVPVVIGRSYRVQAERSGGNSYVTLGSVSQAADYWDSDFLTTDVDETVVPTTSSLFITARNFNSTTPALIDNVSVIENSSDSASYKLHRTQTKMHRGIGFKRVWAKWT